ncbi:alpha/beta hydrolase [Pararhodobacter zhoushanensis]|uniref:alpha/beta hydrolase n=1 Tax=Pararhodobacter zhoushanensis TaxID=2479545 RepID=UPI000F8F196C|nr:alpha/beta hydrolase [Pararhodobacter zhoushanensis]
MKALPNLDASLDGDALNAAYNPVAYVGPTVFAQRMAAYRDASDRALATLPVQAGLCYDPASGQCLDLFPAGPGTPLVVYIHGGYWRALSRAESRFPALGLVPAGISFATLDYALAPDTSLVEITRQCRAALAYLWHNAQALGIDRNRMIVTGSSAGGHLAAMLMVAGWQADFGLPEDALAGGVPISGLFDLSPIARSFVQAWLGLAPADIAALSPLSYPLAQGCRAILAWGSDEPSGFATQSRALQQVWRNARLMELPDRDHFDAALDLTDPDSPLFKALVSLIPVRTA